MCELCSNAMILPTVSYDSATVCQKLAKSQTVIHKKSLPHKSCCRVERSPKSSSILGRSEDGSINYQILTEERVDAALDVLINGFYPDEPVCSLLEVSKSAEAVKELNLLSANIAKDAVSVIAVDSRTGSVVGVSFNKLQAKTAPGELPFFEKFKREVCKTEKAIAVIDFMAEIDSMVDIFDLFNTKQAAELVFLSVLPTYRDRQIGVRLVTESLNLFTRADVPVACMIGTSRYTQRIANRLNFRNLAEYKYEKGQANDLVFQEIHEVHEKSILLAKSLLKKDST